MKAGLAAGTTTALGAGALYFSTEPAMALSMDSWDAGANESITTTDGTIDAVMMSPEVTIEYANFEPDRTAEIVLAVEYFEGSAMTNSMGSATPWETTLDLPGTDGQATKTLLEYHITSFEGITLSDFYAPAEGESTTRWIRATLSVSVPDQPGIDPASLQDDFSVTVTYYQPDASATVSASSSTTLLSDKEVTESS